MQINLNLLQIETIIVHEVPERQAGQDAPAPKLSEATSPVSDPVKNFFLEKVRSSLSDAACDVRFSSDTDSKVPSICERITRPNATEFVAHSQELARQLQAAQTATTSGGLLAVADARAGARKALLIVKLEKEAGIRVRETKNNNDKLTLSLEHLRDLMLTEKTRVFKVGLFVQRGKSIASIMGKVSDNQRSFSSNQEIAGFFLKKFLGCHQLESPAVVTKRFISFAQTFINEDIPDPEDKTRYQLGLAAELSNQNATLKPRTFARKVLDPKHRDNFNKALRDAEFCYREFEKDIKVVNAVVSGIRMDFKSGITVIGPNEAVDEHIEWKTGEDGESVVEIKDELKSLKGK